MAKLWVVIRREYLERVRSRWFAFATIVGPLFFGGITIGSAVLSQHVQISSDVSHIIVLDATGRDLGHRVANNLGQGIAADTSTADVRTVTPATETQAESTALVDVMHNRWLGYLVLTDTTTDGVGARYYGRNASAVADVDHIRSVVRQAVLADRLVAAGLDPKRIAALTAVPLQLHTERVTDNGLGGAGGISGAYFGYMVALLLYITIVLYGQSIVRGVADEKATRVSEVVVASAPPDTLLAGKIIGVGAVAITQQIVWVLASVAIIIWRRPILELFHTTDVPLALPSISVGAALVLLLIFLLGFFFYSCLFAAVGSTVENQDDAQQATLPVMMGPLLSVMFMGAVVLSPASLMSRVVSWVPFFAPILMPLRLSLIPVQPIEVFGTIIGLVLANIAAIWVAARIYRAGILMYGKRRSIREIIRWLRVS